MPWARKVLVLSIAVWLLVAGLTEGFVWRRVHHRRRTLFSSAQCSTYEEVVEALLSEPEDTYVKQSLNRRLTSRFRSMGLSHLKDVARKISTNLNNSSQHPVFDHITATAAVSSCQRHGLNHEAYQLFCGMNKSSVKIDGVTMMAVIRAVVKIGEIETILSCLDYCLNRVRDALGNCLQIAVETSAYASVPRGHAQKLLKAIKDWAEANGLWNSPDVLEQYSVAVCKLGMSDEISRLPELNEDCVESFVGSSRSYGAVLAKCCAMNDADTVARALRLMETRNIKQDAVILNILVQFYSKTRNVPELMKVLKVLVESGQAPNDASLVILRDLHSFPWDEAERKDWQWIAASLNVSKNSQNSFTICNDIVSCESTAVASSLFAEAEARNMTDAPIAVALAEKFVGLEQSFEQAFQLLETFIKRNGMGGNNLLRAMTKFVVEKYLMDGDAAIKGRLLRFFDDHRSVCVCDAPTANNVLELVSRMGDGAFLLRLRRTHLASFCLPRHAVDNLVSSVSHTLSSLSSQPPQNTMLLDEILLYSEVVAQNMKERPGRWQGWSVPLLESFVKYVGQRGCGEDCRRLLAALENSPFRPSGRIVHDFTKFFRNFGDIEGSAAVLHWIGANRNHLSPVSIVNAIVAHLYDAGEKHRALALFQQYAKVHRIANPWLVDPTDGIQTLDLHYRSRGGAYVLLMTYLTEALSKAAGQDFVRIITGQSLNSPNGRVPTGMRERAPYRLSDEVQNILIEEFFPPIPSSTEPGNPGRIIVRMADIGRSSQQ